MSQNSQLKQTFPGAAEKALGLRLQAVLDGEFVAERNAVRKFISTPGMAPVAADIPKEDYRKLTLQRVRDLIDAGFTKMPYKIENGGTGQGSSYINVVEMLAHADMSLAIKQGVQFGLFGLSVERLGTEKHQPLVKDIISGDLLGGFAMTEKACGSDVQGTLTEAVYDHASRSFTINTPSEEARKTYIGNAAVDGKMMVVFAQLKMTPEGESQGPHAFLVPIRDEKGAAMPGVEIGDNGHKIGLNGVDNGTLAFRSVKVPYDALLDRFGRIDEAGEYKSDIAKKSARFFKTIGTLVTGRLFISMSALSGSKNALASIVDFAENRKVFGDILLDKQATQSRLMPRLADAYALHFATRTVLGAFEKESPELETMAAAIKTVSSDRAIETLDEARKLAGGAGYMSEQRYGVLRNDIDISRTFEGDNTVLRMLVAKNQMTRLGQKFRGASKVSQFVKNLAMKKNDHLSRLKASGADQGAFLDPEFQVAIFAGRERAMMHDLSRKIVKLSKGGDKDRAANLCQDDMIAYSDAYADRLMMKSFVDAVADQKDPEVKALLKDVCDLFAVHSLRRNATWYLENGYLDGKSSQNLARMEHELNEKIRPQAATLVGAFAIPRQLLTGQPPAPSAARKPAPKRQP